MILAVAISRWGIQGRRLLQVHIWHALLGAASVMYTEHDHAGYPHDPRPPNRARHCQRWQPARPLPRAGAPPARTRRPGPAAGAHRGRALRAPWRSLAWYG